MQHITDSIMPLVGLLWAIILLVATGLAALALVGFLFYFVVSALKSLFAGKQPTPPQP
jgi:short subunit fatty acids transporter